MPQAAIEKLDVPTRIKLRSSQILTSLSQLVSELVQNSLDAGATNIDIGVDCEEWLCWVKDDGEGISKDGLSLLGSGLEAGRYGSSKQYQIDALNSLSTFGFRGEALASAADLSCLEISSRTARSRETWSIITKGGKNLYSGPAVRWRRESPGTAVCVRDAFYNLPVRRLAHPPPARTLELIRQEIETYALVFPGVSFTLENVRNEREAGPSKGHILRIPKTSSSLASFRNLFGRALTEHVNTVELSSGSLKLDGFISLNGAHSKGYQFLYVNRHPVDRCDLHHIIDSGFASSSFGKNALDEAGEVELPRSNVRRSPRKAEKRPVYVLNLTVPSEQVDNCLEPAKAHLQFRQKDAVVAFLSSSVESFLVRNGFLVPGQPKPQQPGSNRSSPSPRKRRKVDFPDDSGYAETMHISVPPSETEYDDAIINRPAVQLFTLDTGNEDARDIAWLDPNTGETFIVDSRTGNSHPQAEPPPGNGGGWIDNYLRRRTIPCCTNSAAEDGKIAAESRVPEWLQKALQANRTYDLAENAVPKLGPSTAAFQRTFPGEVSARFRKEDLHRAKVISQVDKKFIACLIEDNLDNDCDQSSSAGPALVLIDQHAADERVRVERFLKDLCLGFLRNGDTMEGVGGVRVKELSPSLPILLTLHEARRLKGSVPIQQAFRRWGFRFDLCQTEQHCSDEATDGDDASGYTQVLVQTIPEVVTDKLLLGDELRDLVKGFLGQLAAEVPPASQTTSAKEHEEEEEFSWLKALRWCPRELLELVNSKACRGAIMFNDTLSISQCENLVQRLSETAFPFQCAHGRPSLVPLTDLGPPVGAHKGIACEWSRLETSL
ncbi:putative mutL C terminal dimerisation domain contatining protein [Lyophyllum shimeji]|uniref:MutL C terminal dimerisation domain contatining protein n=1 Tax=Lyophyllum shimeji TaxID=47721 RepID=A0A9P3PEL0_LYOSH|nr:putative mutL C terminal dimerisation domain contatining protein [Lyophyllum shimeji]